MSPTSSPTRYPSTSKDSADILRLVWPQWQHAGAAIIDRGSGGQQRPEAEAAQRSAYESAYEMGVRVLQMLLPDHEGPTEIVPVAQGSLPTVKTASVRAARAAIARHRSPRILTLGGDSAVSVVPFTELADRYGPDLAVVWIDSHPDIGTACPGHPGPGYRAMAISHIIGTGDPEVLDELSAVVDPSHVALAGLYSWTEEEHPGIATWGLHAFSPQDLSEDSSPLLEWLASTGCGRVAIHLDVDTVDTADGEQVRLGLGLERSGLSLSQANRVMRDLDAVADVVGLTIAEYVPLQVVALARLLTDLPLV